MSSNSHLAITNTSTKECFGQISFMHPFLGRTHQWVQLLFGIDFTYSHEYCIWHPLACDAEPVTVSLGFISLRYKIRSSIYNSDSWKKSPLPSWLQCPLRTVRRVQLNGLDLAGLPRVLPFINFPDDSHRCPPGDHGMDIANTTYNIMFWIHSTIMWKKKKEGRAGWVRSITHAAELPSSPSTKLT